MENTLDFGSTTCARIEAAREKLNRLEATVAMCEGKSYFQVKAMFGIDYINLRYELEIARREFKL